MKLRQMLRWRLAPLIIFLVLGWYFKEPLRVAVWDEGVRVLAQIEIKEDDSAITFKGIRDWKYDGYQQVATRDYFSQTYQLEGLERSWFYLQPLDATGLIAHPFVAFEFDESYGDKRYLGISIETRRQQGEECSLLKGGFSRFYAGAHLGYGGRSHLTAYRLLRL